VVRFIIRRLFGIIFILWVVSVVTFVIFFLAPKALGSDPAVLYAGRSPSAEALEGVREKLGLNHSLISQYWEFIHGIFFGRHYNSPGDDHFCPAPCLGYSFKTNEPVWQLILSDLPVTISLAIGAAILWLITGVLTGIISALYPGSIFDRCAMGIALAGVSLPIYFTGLVALSLFSYRWQILPHSYVPITQNPLEWAHNLILPCVCLAFLYAALYARLVRASMLETLGEDYVRTARAKGLPERRVIGKHALRAALTPVVTIFGLDLGGVLGGAVLLEATFGYNGIGKLSLTAIDNQDLPVVLGVTLFAAFFILMANLVVDVLYAVVDPRVRLG
jgi:peptide/nickel transport system permease protein